MDAGASHLLKVYYDGLCHLCSREIDHYKRQRGAEQILFVDITAQSFNANEEGVDPIAVHNVMHAKDPQGNILLGVDAFIAIWRLLPKYQWAARGAQLAPIKKLLNRGYAAFARIRPYLPRKKDDCSNSPYCDRHNHAANKLST